MLNEPNERFKTKSATKKKIIWVEMGFEAKNKTSSDFSENMIMVGVMKIVRKMIIQRVDNLSKVERVCLKIGKPVAQGSD